MYIESAPDPRHKHLRFVAQTLRSEIVKNLSEMFRRVPDRRTSATTNDTRVSGHEAEGTSTATESDSENQPARAAATTGADTRAVSLNTLFGEDYFTQDPDHNEVELYFNEPCIPPQENPLQWWRKNEGRYRKLSVLAKEYLAIPATSVPAERVFSTAGLIVNCLRTRLSPEHVDMLIFLNKNE